MSGAGPTQWPLDRRLDRLESGLAALDARLDRAERRVSVLAAAVETLISDGDARALRAQEDRDA